MLHRYWPYLWYNHTFMSLVFFTCSRAPLQEIKQMRPCKTSKEPPCILCSCTTEPIRAEEGDDVTPMFCRFPLRIHWPGRFVYNSPPSTWRSGCCLGDRLWRCGTGESVLDYRTVTVSPRRSVALHLIITGVTAAVHIHWRTAPQLDSCSLWASTSV